MALVVPQQKEEPPQNERSRCGGKKGCTKLAYPKGRQQAEDQGGVSCRAFRRDAHCAGQLPGNEDEGGHARHLKDEERECGIRKPECCKGQVGKDIDRRVQKGLYAGWRDIEDRRAAMEQGVAAIKVIVQEVPVLILPTLYDIPGKQDNGEHLEPKVDRFQQRGETHRHGPR